MSGTWSLLKGTSLDTKGELELGNAAFRGFQCAASEKRVGGELFLTHSENAAHVLEGASPTLCQVTNPQVSSDGFFLWLRDASQLALEGSEPLGLLEAGRGGLLWGLGLGEISCGC